MNIVILGGGGFLGQKLAQALAARGHLRGAPIAGLVLADLSEPAMVAASFPVTCRACDITRPDSLAGVIDAGTDVVIHLAAVVSSHAEADLDAGLQVNLFGTFNVLERCRALATAPVVIYASSLAVFGGDVPVPVEDWTMTTPQTSYGTQKAMGELLLNDYSRRGLVRGRGFRLPTIAVRPGKPNRAASSFMSSIIREPLSGQRAICPVGRDFAHFYLSPRRCIENLIKGAEWDQDQLGAYCSLTMPGLRCTLGDMIDALTDVAGPEPAKLIDWTPLPEIEAIVTGWRADFVTDRARDLGLLGDSDFRENVRYFLADDLPEAP